MKNEPTLTDDQEEKIDILIRRWTDGEIPARISKDVVKKTRVVKNVLELYYEIMKLVPESYFSVNAEHRNNGEIPNTVHFIDVDKEKDFFVLHNYSYTGTEGWKKTQYSKVTPLDDVMKVGKVFSEKNCRDVLSCYKGKKDSLIKLEWSSLSEELQYLAYGEVMRLLKEELEPTYQIVGQFPDSVCLLRKGAI